MITLDARVKKMFFDRLEVERILGKKRAQTVGKMAGYAAKTAKRSMRRVGKKGKPSPAGSPPRWHGGDPSLRTILYALDPITERAIAGPIAFNQKHYRGTQLVKGTIPSLMEVGGVLGIREKLVGREWRPIGKRKPRPGQPTRRRNATYEPRPFMKPAQTKTIQRFREVYFSTSSG